MRRSQATLVIIAFSAGCGSACYVLSPGIHLSAKEAVRAGDAVSITVNSASTGEAMSLEWYDSLGNHRASVPLTPLGGQNFSSLAAFRGRLKVLEPLTEMNTLRIDGFRETFETRPLYPAPYPVIITGRELHSAVSAWVSSSVCKREETAEPSGSLLEMLEKDNPICVDGSEPKTVRRMAGFLAPLRRICTPVDSPEIMVLDNAGNPVPGISPFAARLDEARVFFIDTGTGGPDVFFLSHHQKGHWHEPMRGISLGPGARNAALYRRPARVTAVTLLPYLVKRIELIVEEERVNGMLLRVEVLSARPVTCRHPLLVELMDGEGSPLPCGIRIATARNGFLRWWFLPGPGWNEKAVLLRVTDLLSGMVAERVMTEETTPVREQEASGNSELRRAADRLPQ